MDGLENSISSFPVRLALTHAPLSQRPAAHALFALDSRLGQFVSQASEPLVAQLRISWWREQLAKPADQRPKGDEVLDALSHHWPEVEGEMTALVDGWERLLAEPPLPEDAAEEFVGARAGIFALLASKAGQASLAGKALKMGRTWAAADLIARTSDDGERGFLLEKFGGLASDRHALPRSLRHLTILGELARRSLARGGSPLIETRSDYLLVMRLGMFGR
ncbi:squalene/phytoene synthase family protein [Erythrobacter sp. HKB08]|uniref:squalene/phytoene synthase family protein n=1 Tax=Erythrobacter sp. HKB08 TaxID=2502843 RepID=UPI001008EBF5|nr:squalene/phytoene synthase family protein [Erythrobacter sp. HKB08]